MLKTKQTLWMSHESIKMSQYEMRKKFHTEPVNSSEK